LQFSGKNVEKQFRIRIGIDMTMDFLIKEFLEIRCIRKIAILNHQAIQKGRYVSENDAIG
jgi:hypothetical protein